LIVAVNKEMERLLTEDDLQPRAETSVAAINDDLAKRIEEPSRLSQQVGALNY
jgi:hypothetical protein